MGGSLSLRIAGEAPELLPVEIKSVIGFSVPCDLKSSAKELGNTGKKFYQDHFLRRLGKKLKLKELVTPSTAWIDAPGAAPLVVHDLTIMPAAL